MRVVITNTQLYNGGDAAILLAIVQILFDVFGNSVEITIFDPNADGAIKYYPDLRVCQMPYHTLGRNRKRLRWALTRLETRFRRFRGKFFTALLSPAERQVLEIY